MKVKPDTSIESLLERQLQVYKDLNKGFKDNPKEHTVSIMQEEPLCDKHYADRSMESCVTCVVSDRLGVRCGKRGFYSLPDYIGNEDLINVTQHAVDVFTAIIDSTPIPDETYRKEYKYDIDGNVYSEYVEER